MTRPLALILACLLATPLYSAEPPAKPPVPRLAVLPFLTPSDRDYGVLISDRLVTGLFQHRDVPALDTRRFELIEPEGIENGTMETILEHLPDLQMDDLAQLRESCRSDFVVVGEEVVPERVTNPGVKTLDLSIVDLKTGEVIWADRVKHDVRYIWISKDWEGGEALIRDVVARLGFVAYDRQPPVFDRGEVPRKIALMPIYNVGNPLLVRAADRFIHQGLIQDKVFTVVYKGEKRLPRAEATAREAALEKEAEAIFIGSMMDAGMAEDIEENVTTAARLVDVHTGQILWSGSASDRRVWRKQTPDAMAESVADKLIQDFFETIERTEANRIETLRRKVGMRVIR